MGGADKCTKFLHLPLWYAHYDNVPSFTDYKAFGGWTTPTVKQYKGTTASCGASIDLNFKPWCILNIIPMLYLDFTVIISIIYYSYMPKA